MAPTQIVGTPFVLKDYLLRIEDSDYEVVVNQVAFTPTSSSQSFIGGTPEAVFTDQSIPTWACTIGAAQDWENDDSFSNFLFDHAGETKPVVFAPLRAGKRAWKADLIMTPMQIGGTNQQFATGSVTLGVVGKPQKVANPLIPTP